MAAISISSFLRFLFGLAVILMPFNNLPYFKAIFGEMANEGAFYGFLLGICFWLYFAFIEDKKVYLPANISIYFLFILIIWVLISGLINIPHILIAETKGRGGLEKFVLQFLVLLFTLVVVIFIYNIYRKSNNGLFILRHYIFISFIIMGIYSFFEFASMLDISWARDLLYNIDPLIRNVDDNSFIGYGRIRSVCGEASWLGMYLSFALPWILSYLLNKKNRWIYFLLNYYLILMIIFTMSRAAYAISGLQLILFFISYGKEIFTRSKSLIIYITFSLLFSFLLLHGIFEKILGDRSIIGVFSSLLLGNQSIYELSNIARFGSQMAAFNMFLDNPISGVGIGQYGFNMVNYLPNWTFVSPEIQLWANSSPDTPWPPVHGLYVRLLGELGLVGFGLWVGVWWTILIKLYKLIKQQILSEQVIMLKALVISIIGVLLSGFNTDSLRFFGYWILLAFSLCYINSYDLRKGRSQ